MSDNDKLKIIVAGKEIDVDLSSLTEEERESLWSVDSVPLKTEDFNLQDGYFVQIQKMASFTSPGEYEFVAERFYHHEPTKQEIMELMAKNKVFRLGVATITKAYEWEFDDYE